MAYRWCNCGLGPHRGYQYELDVECPIGYFKPILAMSRTLCPGIRSESGDISGRYSASLTVYRRLLAVARVCRQSRREMIDYLIPTKLCIDHFCNTFIDKVESYLNLLGCRKQIRRLQLGLPADIVIKSDRCPHAKKGFVGFKLSNLGYAAFRIELKDTNQKREFEAARKVIITTADILDPDQANVVAEFLDRALRTRKGQKSLDGQDLFAIATGLRWSMKLWRTMVDEKHPAEFTVD